MTIAITSITHPAYDAMLTEWQKYRLTFKGGKDFIDEYLVRLSARETATDFTERQSLTYCPAHAKAALTDIKNSIFSRMVDITREGGPDSYAALVTGGQSGVDRNGSSMNSFIGREVLPELLSMSKVGVYVDKMPVAKGGTKRDMTGLYPYLYIYTTENIRTWTYNAAGQLTAVLLKELIDDIDPETGLTIGLKDQYRYLKLVETGGVDVIFYDADGAEIPEKSAHLDLMAIPFVIFEIPTSLLIDVADYQIALLNLASSDMYYSIKSNFPFYTEQFNPSADNTFTKSANPLSGKAGEAADNRARTQDVTVGVTKGRRYPKDLDRPDFIHPSPEPLMASMAKQEQMKKEIRQLVNLSLANMDVGKASAESKQEDNRGLEAGLAYIGFVLEQGERMIAKAWAEYEGASEAGTYATINYPSDYQLTTEAERRAEAAELYKIMPTIPSLTFQKQIAKRISAVMLGNKVSLETQDTIATEIDKAVVVCIDPTILREDHEAGFVGTQLASELRGYPAGQVEQAKKDHADRLARIAIAQSEAPAAAAAARGNPDAGDPSEGREEKEASRNVDDQPTTEKRTRGAAK